MSLLKQLAITIGRKGTISLENIGFAITAIMLLGAVISVTGNTIVLDTEEKAHILNAKAMASAVEFIVTEDNLGPFIGGTRTVYLSECYEADLLAPAIDPSSRNGALYHANESAILVESVQDATGRYINEYFARLVSQDGTYVYADQTNSLTPASERVSVKNMSLDEVHIPPRNTSGF